MSRRNDRLTWRQFFVAYASGTGEYLWAVDLTHACLRLMAQDKDVESVHPVTERR